MILITSALPATSVASGLAPTLMRTARTVTVFGQDQIQAQAPVNVNDRLDQLPAINVERGRDQSDLPRRLRFG